MDKTMITVMKWLGLAATCLGAVCSGLAADAKVDYKVKKEVDKQMKQRGLNGGMSYEKVEKDCKKGNQRKKK